MDAPNKPDRYVVIIFALVVVGTGGAFASALSLKQSYADIVIGH